MESTKNSEEPQRVLRNRIVEAKPSDESEAPGTPKKRAGSEPPPDPPKRVTRRSYKLSQGNGSATNSTPDVDSDCDSISVKSQGNSPEQKAPKITRLASRKNAKHLDVIDEAAEKDETSKIDNINECIVAVEKLHQKVVDTNEDDTQFNLSDENVSNKENKAIKVNGIGEKEHDKEQENLPSEVRKPDDLNKSIESNNENNTNDESDESESILEVENNLQIQGNEERGFLGWIKDSEVNTVSDNKDVEVPLSVNIEPEEVPSKTPDKETTEKESEVDFEKEASEIPNKETAEIENEENLVDVETLSDVPEVNANEELEDDIVEKEQENNVEVETTDKVITERNEENIPKRLCESEMDVSLKTNEIVKDDHLETEPVESYDDESSNTVDELNLSNQEPNVEPTVKTLVEVTISPLKKAESPKGNKRHPPVSPIKEGSSPSCKIFCKTIKSEFKDPKDRVKTPPKQLIVVSSSDDSSDDLPRDFLQQVLQRNQRSKPVATKEDSKQTSSNIGISEESLMKVVRETVTKEFKNAFNKDFKNAVSEEFKNAVAKEVKELVEKLQTIHEIFVNELKEVTGALKELQERKRKFEDVDDDDEEEEEFEQAPRKKKKNNHVYNDEKVHSFKTSKKHSEEDFIPTSIAQETEEAVESTSANKSKIKKKKKKLKQIDGHNATIDEDLSKEIAQLLAWKQKALKDPENFVKKKTKTGIMSEPVFDDDDDGDDIPKEITKKKKKKRKLSQDNDEELEESAFVKSRPIKLLKKKKKFVTKLGPVASPDVSFPILDFPNTELKNKKKNHEEKIRKKKLKKSSDANTFPNSEAVMRHYQDESQLKKKKKKLIAGDGPSGIFSFHKNVKFEENDDWNQFDTYESLVASKKVKHKKKKKDKTGNDSFRTTPLAILER